MNVSEIMTMEPSYCVPNTDLQEIAAMMVAEDCGEIPVCESGTKKPIGVVTDRDIVCRTVAKGLNPLSLWDYHWVKQVDDEGFIDRLIERMRLK